MKRARLTILLIEDSDDDALIVQRAFAQLGLGHELVREPTGEAAVERLKSRQGRPHLALLDLNLPGLSGLEVLRWIRASEAYRRLPVIILSASGRDADVTAAYEAGANHYLVKPLEFEVFVDLVRRFDEYWGATGRLPPRA